MAVGYDNSNSAEGSSTNPTVSLTVAAGTIAIVGLWVNNSPTISASTFDGSAMSLIKNHLNSAYLYRYHGHAAGTRAASFTLNTAEEWGICVATLTGFDTSTPVGTDQLGTSTEAAVTTTAAIASAADQMIVDFGFLVGTDASMAPSAGQTQRQRRLSINGAFRSIGMSTKPGAASTTMGWEMNATFGDNYVLAVPVRALVVPTGAAVGYLRA